MEKYVYNPYHSWRHKYKRERGLRLLLLAARLILAAECLWLAYSYVQGHTSYTVTEEAGGDSAGEIFGIGIDRDQGGLIFFHSRPENVSVD